jgi:uncharacterized membrane protein (UPF0127 family)
VAWLIREGEVLAALDVADTLGGRFRGLRGRDGVEGALLLRPCRSVHTMGMHFPIDVAFCRGRGDETFVVLSVVEMRPWRLGRPRPRATCVIEAEAGAFGRWRLRPGDALEIKG